MDTYYVDNMAERVLYRLLKWNAHSCFDSVNGGHPSPTGTVRSIGEIHIQHLSHNLISQLSGGESQSQPETRYPIRVYGKRVSVYDEGLMINTKERLYG